MSSPLPTSPVKTENWPGAYFIFVSRYIESGVFRGMAEDVVGPKIQGLLGVPAEKFFVWEVYTTSDLKLRNELKDSDKSSSLSEQFSILVP